MQSRIRPSASVAVALMLLGAAADVTAEPRLLLSGFGTLGYAVLDDDDAEYRGGNARDGADDAGSFEVDSRLGVQLDLEATDRLSVTLQGLAREGSDGDPEARLEWAFARWLASETVSVRIGRLALPIYALSDFREIGYANVPLRPPEEVYARVPLRSADGADVNAYADVGDTLVRAQLFAGQVDGDIHGTLDFEARDAIGASLVLERGPLRLRLGHTVVRFGIEGAPLRLIRDGIAQAASAVPELASLEDAFSDRHRRTRFSTVGLSLDFERTFLDAEYTQRRVDSWVPDVDAWHVTAGVRIGTLTPYAFVAAFDGVEARRTGLEATAPAPLVDIVNAFLFAKDQSAAGLGLRWDFAPNLALKGQLERVRAEDERASDSFERGQLDPAPDDGDAWLGSVAIDFVF